jgi:formylglycine-generating enzyme required for sulfatase activity/polyisoprenoid-binding protein YceI
MSRKTTAALIAALGINFALAGGALFLANLNKPNAYTGDDALSATYRDIKKVAGKPVDAGAGDLAVPLKAAQQGGNTRVTFRCGKDMGPAGREEHEGTWDQIAGAVLYRPEQQELIAVEAVFDTRSLRTDAHGLTQTVTTKEKWFDIDKHPKATFTCDRIEKVESDAPTPSHTHELIGEFTLNGITKAITIPATLAFAGQTLTLDAAFTILRSDYDVEKRASSLAGSVGGAVSKVDDEVELAVRVTASPDPMAVLSELAQVVEEQKEQLRIASVERDRLRGLSLRIEQLEDQAGRTASVDAGTAPIDVDESSLPKRYTDAVPVIGGQAPFEMVLVPGDDDEGVAPFYMSKHEVTWGMLRHWMEGFELDTVEGAKLIDAGLHPSIVFGTPSQTIQVGDHDNPAMAMSYRTATLYCKWVSEKTGRRYRLPTIEEWQYALSQGGGVPDDIDAYAWHAKNSPLRGIDQLPTTSEAGTKKPNKLGIHDMLGGVAEWVTDTGEKRVVVGGSIFTEPGDITADWRAIEDIDVWSANYPQFPKSRYWYSDFYVTGIRLVCEPASVAANPPKVGEAEE